MRSGLAHLSPSVALSTALRCQTCFGFALRVSSSSLLYSQLSSCHSCSDLAGPRRHGCSAPTSPSTSQSFSRPSCDAGTDLTTPLEWAASAVNSAPCQTRSSTDDDASPEDPSRGQRLPSWLFGRTNRSAQPPRAGSGSRV